MNPRMTKKELNLLKGAIRRVFSRSDLRREAIAKVVLPHYSDPTRPRVKKWVLCEECKLPTPAYQAQVDHILPIVPIDTSFELMSIDALVNNLWCESNNLQVLDKACHNKKCKEENRIRRLNKKENKI